MPSRKVIITPLLVVELDGVLGSRMIEFDEGSFGLCAWVKTPSIVHGYLNKSFSLREKNIPNEKNIVHFCSEVCAKNVNRNFHVNQEYLLRC